MLSSSLSAATSSSTCSGARRQPSSRRATLTTSSTVTRPSPLRSKARKVCHRSFSSQATSTGSVAAAKSPASSDPEPSRSAAPKSVAKSPRRACSFGSCRAPRASSSGPRSPSRSRSRARKARKASMRWGWSSGSWCTITRITSFLNCPSPRFIRAFLNKPWTMAEGTGSRLSLSQGRLSSCEAVGLRWGSSRSIDCTTSRASAETDSHACLGKSTGLSQPRSGV
mmetsp:Transcript_35442/g.110526  ORF Transcript_35442/g.110526 Transcript_35442/m.110526 type:complete len:225 (-) Transcript_35442:685-1359(-)